MGSFPIARSTLVCIYCFSIFCLFLITFSPNFFPRKCLAAEETVAAAVAAAVAASAATTVAVEISSEFSSEISVEISWWRFRRRFQWS
ncbi:uncharacterized protein LOC114320785 isoform X1 [Camellia sinensis]|uniref:uncharacterized protein LOC114320785 isoform X1 n=1 Tax=Camellia sinensis TaxID=4442 RepID=UPI00103604D6|nr:uncharacterized protein LOC114320785 isoform X1 [Camellia sinensis]